MKLDARLTNIAASRSPGRTYFVLAPRTLTFGELILCAAICFIGLTIFNGLLLDFLGFPINSLVVFIATILELAPVLHFLVRRYSHEIALAYGELFACLLIVGSVTAYMVYPSLPGGLPPSHHFDAVNHVLLANFIYDHEALPRDMTGSSNPFFMSWYPAGGALLAAVASHWVGSDPFRTLHPIASIILGLSAGVIFLLITRLLQNKPFARPVSLLATMLLFTAWNYFPGLVNERYVYAQVVAQFFALAAFFFAYLYWAEPDVVSLLLASFAAGMVSVSHPTALVAAIAAVLGTILLHPRISREQKVFHGGLFVIGLLPISSIYVIQHIQYWTRLTGYGEAVSLSVDTIGLVLPVLAMLGVGFVMRSGMKHLQRFPLILTAAVLAQPIALLALRPFIQGIDTQFFERSIYLLIYPLAMLSAIPLLEFAQGIQIRLPGRDFSIAAWSAALAVSATILVVSPPRPFAPLTLAELTAADWAEHNLAPDNIAIVSSLREDAYWIQLAVFGSGFGTPALTAAYEIGPMDYAEWRGNPGPPDYALVRNSNRLSLDPAVTVVYKSDESAILLKPRAAAAVAPPVEHATDLRFGDMFDLVGYDLVESGFLNAPLTATLYWRPLHWPSARVAMFVQVLDSLGQVVTRSESGMLQERFPTQRWPIGSVVTDTWKVSLPVEAGAGDYTLEIAVFDQYSGRRLSISGSSAQSPDEISLGPIHVSIPPPSALDLSYARPIQAHFGNGITLLSYYSTIRHVDATSTLDVTLYWQSAAPIADDYTVFVHLIDPSGRLVAQSDSPPQNGTFRTPAWLPNQIVQDPYHIKIPGELTSGSYSIDVGLYTPADLKRLPVDGTDHVTLPEAFSLK